MREPDYIQTPTGGSSESSTTPSVSATPSHSSSNSSSGLSVGAAAGIGVAAATVVCVLVGLGVWFAYLRRVKSRPLPQQPSGWYQQTHPQPYNAGPGLQKPHPVEMQSPQQRHELETSRL